MEKNLKKGGKIDARYLGMFMLNLVRKGTENLASGQFKKKWGKLLQQILMK